MAHSQSVDKSMIQATKGGMDTRKQRVKRYHAKTTTGCLTCRRRRVKCGEEKPECARCQRGGVRCDGYIIRSRNTNMNMNTVPLAHYVDPGHRAFSTVPNSVEIRYGTPEESTCLDFYLKRTGPVISMASPVKDMWTVVVPQVSWHFSPIKHMLCALVLVDQKHDEPGAQAQHIQVAPAQYAEVLNEYYRAISALRASKAPDLASAILFSIMAWTFDAIITNYDNAMLHEQATRSMLADSKKPGTRLSMQDQLVIERVERSLDQGNVACGQPYPVEPRLHGSFTNLQESWRELYYVIERAASNIDLLVTHGWGPVGQSLEEWRAAYETYRSTCSSPLQQKRSLTLALNMVATYLISMDPQSTRSSWERERDCLLTLDDLETVLPTYDNLDDIRWIASLTLLNVVDVATASEHVRSRVQALNRLLEKSALKAREVSPELEFIVSIESTMPAKHAVLRKARTLWIERNRSVT